MGQVITEDQRKIIEGVVREGAVALTMFGPADWRERLSRRVEDIDVSDAEHCPLAIIFGGYNEGLRILGLSASGEASAHGFCYAAGLSRPLDIDFETWLAAVYAVMAAAWRREAPQSLAPAR